ncbi:transglutaminase-like cysteine peptidase [Chromatiaceae bacterium AAb-1]|nr:transglutaminase-like cysteine peptidase [Chromatiaceae bacterium AAb-1]
MPLKIGAAGHREPPLFSCKRKLILLCCCLLFTPFIAISYYQINFSIFHQQMQARYGPERRLVAEQWETMLHNLALLSEQEKLLRVNQFFQQHLRYKSDLALWGTEDYWATPLETLGKGMGDCEDYAIAKYASLRYAGISDQKLRLIYVRARTGGEHSTQSVAHMVLGYYAGPDAEPLILDSLVSSVLPASERPDLAPVFSFNSEGLWAGHTGNQPAAASPVSRLSRWRDVLERMQQEGIVWQQR